MANHVIKEPKEYTDILRRLETTDPGHADLFNDLFDKLINNDAFLMSRIAEGGTITDPQTKSKYKWGIENGLVYLQEVE